VEAPRFFLLLLALTGLAISADQFAAPLLRSSTSLWALLACILLIWRREQAHSLSDARIARFTFSFSRFAAFLVAHAVLIFAARSVQTGLQAVAGTMTVAGTAVAILKLSVLAPSVFLAPFSSWKEFFRIWRAESIAALVVLLTFFPGRIIESLWPWYGQALGQFVYLLSHVFVGGIGYVSKLNPTLTGRDLNVTIIVACSGMNGIELFDYLFGAIAVLDWNRFRKGRLLAGYFLGLFAMLLGNALRITSLVVFGNAGFAEIVARYHVSAGWIFFSFVFLVYLALAYTWMLKKKPSPPAERMAAA